MTAAPVCLAGQTHWVVGQAVRTETHLVDRVYKLGRGAEMRDALVCA